MFCFVSIAFCLDTSKKGFPVTLSSFKEGIAGSWSDGCAPGPPCFPGAQCLDFFLTKCSILHFPLLVLVGIGMILTQILARSSYPV